MCISGQAISSALQRGTNRSMQEEEAVSRFCWSTLNSRLCKSLLWFQWWSFESVGRTKVHNPFGGTIAAIFDLVNPSTPGPFVHVPVLLFYPRHPCPSRLPWLSSIQPRYGAIINKAYAQSCHQDRACICSTLLGVALCPIWKASGWVDGQGEGEVSQQL